MKRMLSLLLLTAMTAALLTGCAAAPASAPAAATPEIAPLASPAEAEAAAVTRAPEEAFAACIEAQAFAVAMAYEEGGYFEGVTALDPAFLWDATGWYAAWLCRTEGIDLLTMEQIRSFQRSLGNWNDEEPPLNWLKYGHNLRVLRGADGTENYDFSGHKARLDETLGQTLEFLLDAPEEPDAAVTLRRHYSLNAVDERVYSLSFSRNRDPGSAFRYCLQNVILPARAPAMDAALDFTWAELTAANSLKNILSLYPAVKITNSYNEELPLWIFRRGGALCILSAGQDYATGQTHGCFFDYERTAEGVMRARISSFSPEAGDETARDGFVSGYLSGAAVVQLDRVDGDLVRTHVTFTGDWLQDMAIDRGTLVLRELSHRIDEETPAVVNRFTYTEQPPAFSFLDGWERPLRKVTLVWESYYGGEHQVRTETVQLPDDWEYIPWEGRWGDYTIYMNEGYTIPYFYPGDGVDYTLYLTTAKG